MRLVINSENIVANEGQRGKIRSTVVYGYAKSKDYGQFFEGNIVGYALHSNDKQRDLRYQVDRSQGLILSGQKYANLNRREERENKNCR